MITVILVGLIAGFLAGKLTRGSGYGLFMDLALGSPAASLGGSCSA